MLEWRKMTNRWEDTTTSWYLVNTETDEIVAWVNKRSKQGITFKYNERYFVSLEGAKRAAEKELLK